ncbi:hypothetical protein NR798_35120 [Archangium gephyra]|uniref:hypothetical protein n=1 Tax=Archangium gephyra TaxID=48 RepID=UPI0035D47B2E
MTPKAQEILEYLMKEYLKAGYPNHNIWNFSPGSQENFVAFQELHARGYITPMGAGREKWLLTDEGAGSILRESPMSRQAEESLAELKELYVEKGFPNHMAWWFTPRPGQEAAFQELRARGYITLTGAGRERWQLTDYGQAEFANG